MSMIETFKANALAIFSTARDAPEIFFPLFAIGLFLIWLKWRFIGKATAKSAQKNFAGWTKDGEAQRAQHETGVGYQDVLVMKPIKFLSLSLYYIGFFGGGALFFWLVEIPNGGLSPKEKLGFTFMILATIIGLYVFILSFMRIRLFTDKIERTCPFRRKFSAPLSGLTSVTPISKTIAGGVFINFNDGRRLRVIPRMSGYRQLLERLSRTDPKLRLLMTMAAKQIQARS